MEAVSTSETTIYFYKTTRQKTPDNYHFKKYIWLIRVGWPGFGYVQGHALFGPIQRSIQKIPLSLAPWGKSGRSVKFSTDHL